MRAHPPSWPKLGPSAAQKVNLAALVEVLLREIATALLTSPRFSLHGAKMVPGTVRQT